MNPRRLLWAISQRMTALNKVDIVKQLYKRTELSDPHKKAISHLQHMLIILHNIPSWKCNQ